MAARGSPRVGEPGPDSPLPCTTACTRAEWVGSQIHIVLCALCPGEVAAWAGSKPLAQLVSLSPWDGSGSVLGSQGRGFKEQLSGLPGIQGLGVSGGARRESRARLSSHGGWVGTRDCHLAAQTGPGAGLSARAGSAETPFSMAGPVLQLHCCWGPRVLGCWQAFQEAMRCSPQLQPCQTPARASARPAPAPLAECPAPGAAQTEPESTWVFNLPPGLWRPSFVTCAVRGVAAVR